MADSTGTEPESWEMHNRPVVHLVEVRAQRLLLRLFTLALRDPGLPEPARVLIQHARLISRWFVARGGLPKHATRRFVQAIVRICKKPPDEHWVLFAICHLCPRRLAIETYRALVASGTEPSLDVFANFRRARAYASDFAIFTYAECQEHDVATCACWEQRAREWLRSAVPTALPAPIVSC